jgi:hypothetical protein
VYDDRNGLALTVHYTNHTTLLRNPTVDFGSTRVEMLRGCEASTRWSRDRRLEDNGLSTKAT